MLPLEKRREVRTQLIERAMKKFEKYEWNEAPKTALCHPKRPRGARGLCNGCYLFWEMYMKPRPVPVASKK